MKNFNQKRENRLPFAHRFLTGMVISLALTLTAFEWTSVTTHPLTPPTDETDCFIEDDETIYPPITYRKVERPKPKANTTEIKIVKELPPEVEPDKPVEETPPEVTPSQEDLTQLTQVNYDDYGGDEIFYEDDIPYAVVEIFAHYDACADLVGDALMTCSKQELANRIKKEFVVSEKLRDIGGRQAANMFFIVDAEGNIHSIKALAASSKAIEKDAIKAIKKLPPLNPAVQQGRNVSLQLTIPIQVFIRD